MLCVGYATGYAKSKSNRILNVCLPNRIGQNENYSSHFAYKYCCRNILYLENKIIIVIIQKKKTINRVDPLGIRFENMKFST